MIVIMKLGATSEQINQVVKRIEESDLEVQVNTGEEQVILGIKGDTRNIQDIAFNSYDGVDKTVRITNTYKLTSREFHPDNTVVDVDGLQWLVHVQSKD